MLLVGYHAMLFMPGGERPAEAFHETFRFVRMPLFAALSGWVYALRQPAFDGALDFVRRRARRLLLPLVSFGLVVVFVAQGPLRLEWPGSFAGVVHDLLRPRPHFWFVESLFAISLIAFLLDRLGVLGRVRHWAACCLFTLLLPVGATLLGFPPSGSTDAIHGTIRLLGSFLLGLGALRFGGQLAGRRTLPVAITLVALGVALQHFAWHDLAKMDTAYGSPLSLLVGAPAVALLLHYRRPFPGLTWLGAPSFSIYLFHLDSILLAGSLLPALEPPFGVAGRYAIVVLTGVALPVLAHFVLIRWTPTRRLFLGMR